MVNVNVSPIQLNDILTTHPALTSLDISDTDFGDEGVLSLSEYLLSRPAITPQLSELNMNRVFPKRTKDRSQAMTTLANLLETRPIQSLRMRGGPKSQLKTDLVPLIFGLINNDKLVLLDVAGNQCGDGLPLAFAKILQHNHTLQTLYWDDNGTTVAGLRSFKIGLARNSSIRKMPLPVLDMAAILKTETDLQGVVTLSSEIQEIVFDNALKATHTPLVESTSSPHSLDSKPSIQPSLSDGSIPGVARTTGVTSIAKKPVEAPRGRLQSVNPVSAKEAASSGGGIVAGFKKGMGLGKKAPTAPANLAPPSPHQASGSSGHSSAEENSDLPAPTGRGHSKSISKASVHRASLLFSGGALPLEDEHGNTVILDPTTGAPTPVNAHRSEHPNPLALPLLTSKEPLHFMALILLAVFFGARNQMHTHNIPHTTGTIFSSGSRTWSSVPTQMYP
jgi:hypothetical protein